MLLVMRVFHVPLILVTAALPWAAQSQSVSSGKPSEPKTSMEWFARASDKMNNRMAGSPPFHMRVTFHAYPGIQLLGRHEKPDILTGDGVYEETWAAPHKWRREVTFAGYHAIEAESENGRRMQASSDYEPSRVLMLLSALLEPVPRDLASKEFRHEGASGWRTHEVTAGSLPLVRISKDYGNSSADITDAFYLSLQGVLIMRNERGLVTRWEDPSLYQGALVPKRIVISAGSDRNLLTAEIKIDPAGDTKPSLFYLPGEPAQPGMTLRPLFPFEVRMPEGSPIYYTFMAAAGGSTGDTFSLHRVLDRNGHYREVELVTGADLSNANTILTALRAQHLNKPKIDGSPCEVETMWSVM
jgi:hypothetical protein